MEALRILGALITLGFGLFSIYSPETLAKSTSITLNGARGRTELRVGFGGFFTAMGAAALVMNDPAGYELLGYGWLGAMIVRVFSVLLDGAKMINLSYIIFAVMELGVALMLIL